MGSVLSVVSSTFHGQSVLSMVAASASAFQPFGPYYFIALLAVLPCCECAEIEPFEDFSDALEELCHEDSSQDLNTCPPALLNVPRFPSHRKPQLPQPSVWRGKTVALKKLYKVVADQTRSQALRLHSLYDLYGPPDWTDPALSFLPSACPFSGNFPLNVIPSAFPFAAPHIVISAPRHSYMDPIIAWTNGVQCQDEAFGNRLIVAGPPSLYGPLPLIVNRALPSPAAAGLTVEPRKTEQGSVECSADNRSSDGEVSDVPSLATDTNDDASSRGSSECGSLDDSVPVPPLLGSVSFRGVVQSSKDSLFRIEEDEERLPDLPVHW